MNYAKSLAFLFILSGCVTPGMEEPEIFECSVIIDNAECVNRKTGETLIIPITKLSGFVCVPPEDYADIKNHHDALHKELNECLQENSAR